MEHMRVNHVGEDIEATAVLPQLDIRILSASLERVEHTDSTAAPAAAPNAPAETPEWKVADRLAELQDQVANLQAALHESENRYARLTTRHETLLQKFEERETTLADNQLVLNQARKRLTALEQQLQLVSSDAADMRQLVADSIQQRRQRELFILKQASEIKRLRKLQP
jgi:chromosome segregation ATPase